MTTQKRKIKRKWGTYAQLTTPGTLLPSQWALSEDTSELIMRTHNELSYDLVILSGLAPSGNFINNNELVTQTAGFNISGNASIGSDIFLTSGTATQKISSSYGLTLETNSGSIIINTSGGSALSLPHFDTLNEPSATPNNRNGTVYYNDDTNTLRLLSNGAWLDLSTGVGSGETNTASNLDGGANPNNYFPNNFGISGGNFGIFAGKVGVDLQFRSLRAGTAVNIYSFFSDYSDLTISVDETQLTLDNIGTSPLSYNKGGTGLTTLGTEFQILRVNSGATSLEWADVISLNIGGSLKSTSLAWTNGTDYSGAVLISYSRILYGKLVHIRVPSVTINTTVLSSNLFLSTFSPVNGDLPSDIRGQGESPFPLLSGFTIFASINSAPAETLVAYWREAPYYLFIRRQDGSDFPASANIRIYRFEHTYFVL